MARQLFGTDGIRAKANTYPLIPSLVVRLGKSIGQMIVNNALGEGYKRVVIGYDTRISGPMLASALQAGLLAQGIDVDVLGVCTTPGVAYLTRHDNYDVGIVISASHNPYQDNGIKLFNYNGMKLPDIIEEKIESLLLDDAPFALPETTGRLRQSAHLMKNYIKAITQGMDFHKWDLPVLVDCANGAASDLFKQVCHACGLSVDFMGDNPDGENINLKCGSTYLKTLSKKVIDGGYVVGIAFDGDADRVLMVDESGNEIDGDFIMAILARDLKRRGQLKGNGVVGTVMSNLGLEVSLKEAGIDLLRASVGDKYVLEDMLKDGYILGGEKSGHIINLLKGTTGDGMLSALMVLRVMDEQSQSLKELASCMSESPQILINVPVKERIPFDDIAGFKDCRLHSENLLGETGRLVLRYSGTEALGRVMVEGFDQTLVKQCANDMANIIRQEIGV